MARISEEIEVAAYDDGSGTIRISLNREDGSGDEYVAIKQGDDLITLSPEAMSELQQALMRLRIRKVCGISPTPGGGPRLALGEDRTMTFLREVWFDTDDSSHPICLNVDDIAYVTPNFGRDKEPAQNRAVLHMRDGTTFVISEPYDKFVDRLISRNTAALAAKP